MQRFAALNNMYLGKPHVGIQLDMWTDSDTHVAFACITATTVAEPNQLEILQQKHDFPQLYLNSEIIYFQEFPHSSKTGENVKQWFLSALSNDSLPASSVIGITPDGAADGQCGLRLIDGLNEKVDTCHLHQLQRAVLYATGLAGKTSRNDELRQLLAQHSRIVQLTRQSIGVAKAVRKAQSAVGVRAHRLLATKKPSETRWGGQYLLVQTNCLLRLALVPAIDEFKRANRNNTEAIVERNESEQGSKAGVPVPASALGLSSDQWDDSIQVEAFLKQCFEVKEMLEHKGHLTGAQSMMMLHQLMKDTSAEFSLTVAKFPTNLTEAARNTRATVKMEYKDLWDKIHMAGRLAELCSHTIYLT